MDTGAAATQATASQPSFAPPAPSEVARPPLGPKAGAISVQPALVADAAALGAGAAAGGGSRGGQASASNGDGGRGSSQPGTQRGPGRPRGRPTRRSGRVGSGGSSRDGMQLRGSAAKYGRGGDRRSSAFRVRRATELGIRPDQVRGRRNRGRPPRASGTAAAAAAAAAAAGLPPFRLEDAPPWPPAANADTAPSSVTLLDAPPELDFLGGDSDSDGDAAAGGGCGYSYDDVEPDGADAFAAILARYRPSKDSGGDAAASSSGVGGSASSVASDGVGAGGGRRKRVRFGGDAGGAAGAADDSDDDASPSFGGPGGAGSKPLRVPACPLRLIVNKAPLADAGMWARLDGSYFRGVLPRDLGLARAAHRLAVRESLWQLRTAPPPPAAAAAASAGTAAAAALSSPMLEDAVATASDGGGGGDTPLRLASDPGSSPRAPDTGVASGDDGASAAGTAAQAQSQKNRGGWKGDPIIRDAARAREQHAARLQKLALQSPGRTGGIAGTFVGAGTTPQPSPLVSLATSPLASPSVLSVVANSASVGGVSGSGDLLPLPGSPSVATGGGGGGGSASPSAAAASVADSADAMAIDGLDDADGVQPLQQPPPVAAAPAGPRTRRLAGIERLTSSLFATADVAALAATAEDALLPRGMYDGGLGVSSLGSASSAASGSAASLSAGGGGLGGFPPSRGSSLALSADGAAVAGPGRQASGAGLTSFQRKVEQQLTISWRQLGPQAAANAVRLNALLGHLEVETAVQALYAQLGRHLAPVSESGPALAAHGLSRFLPAPEPEAGEGGGVAGGKASASLPSASSSAEPAAPADAGADTGTGATTAPATNGAASAPATAPQRPPPLPHTVIPLCVATDADGVPLVPSTTAAGALLPSTDGRLENAYWALAGPRCELGYSAALLAKRTPGSSWRFAADGGALAATTHRPVPASSAGAVSVPAQALPTSAAVATASLRGGALDAFDACLAPMACERYVRVVPTEPTVPTSVAPAAVGVAPSAASGAASAASARDAPTPLAATDIESQPTKTAATTVASMAAVAPTVPANGAAAAASPTGGAGKTLLSPGGRPRRGRGHHGGVWLPASALDAAAAAEEEGDDGSAIDGDEEEEEGEEDGGGDDDEEEGGDGDDDGDEDDGGGDTSEDEEEEKRQRLGNAYNRTRPPPFPTAPLLMPGVANGVVSWGPPVEALLPQLRPRPMSEAPPVTDGDAAAADDGSAPPAAKRQRTDEAGPSVLQQLLAGGSDDECSADGGAVAAAVTAGGATSSPARAAAGAGAGGAAVSPGGKLTRAGLTRLKGRARVDARRRELLRCALAASDAVYDPAMLSVVVPSPTSLAAALAAAAGESGAGSFRPTVTRTPSAQSTRALTGGGSGASATVFSFPESSAVQPLSSAGAAVPAAPAGPIPGAVRSTEMPLNLELAAAVPHAAAVRWLLADCARAAGLSVPESPAAAASSAAASGAGGKAAAAPPAQPQQLPSLDVEGVITAALSAASSAAVGLAASTALDDDLAWFAGTVPLGTVVESRDAEEDWCLAVVVGEARDGGALRRHVRVHYAGWDSTADDWLAVGDGRLAPLGAHLPLTR